MFTQDWSPAGDLGPARSPAAGALTEKTGKLPVNLQTEVCKLATGRPWYSYMLDADSDSQ